MPDRPTAWYSQGLRFSCSGCGACCRGPGHVWMSRPEIEALAASLNLEPDVFGRRYLRRVGERLSLVERQNGDCVFWNEGSGCEVYAERPLQCRTFPFWPENLVSRQAWRESAQLCHGMNQGRLYRQEEIVQLAAKDGATDPGPTGCSCQGDEPPALE